MGNEQHDLVWGRASIAREIGLSEPKAKKLLEAGRLPANLIDGKWCASRALLRKVLVGPLDGAGRAD